MLPMVVVKPKKFALLSCVGSLCLFSSIGFLRGWNSHLKSVLSKDRLPFSLAYILSLFGSFLFSVIIHSYIGSLVFIILHAITLAWYLITYIPGGTTGLRAMFGMRNVFI